VVGRDVAIVADFVGEAQHELDDVLAGVGNLLESI
jgi:hypothetical protein